ncbi:unnamed protein product [Rotaria sordida]|uniref:Translation elongation factor EFTu/EF1A C-terminal domain-containing protein n=2 Tax=Rotaria sordida TaxID=392033 RepID=A0A814UY18_9BILA|nr:unnamed protein product [Rotaria sordida]
MKKELLNVKHQYEHQNSALDELRKEIIDLSMQVLKEASAHLLIPFIEQVTKQLENENEEQTNLISEEPDDFQKFYNKYYLEIIKSDVALDEGPLTTIDNVINDFVKQSKIANPDFIDLLINKTNRNQRENSIKLIVDDNDKVNLIKLLNNVFLNQFDTLQERNDMIIAPFRMSIVEQDKENGAIVMGEIESGSYRIGDQCLIMPNQTRVEITNIYHEDSKTDSGVYGQNVQLELKNVEEEKISPGFILCDAQQKPCRVGRIFESEVMIIKHQSKIYPGYIDVLRIHAAVTRVYLKELIKLIDPKTGQTTRKKPKFIKQDQVAIVRFELSQSEQVICMEQFRHFPRLGRFALLNKNGSVAVGKVLKIIE